MPEQYTPQEILALPMPENDADAATIGQYFTALLHALWMEKEGFDGKRPFGNSGWEGDVEKALIKADAIWGKIDEDGYIEDCDSDAADRIIRDTLIFLHKADWKTVQEYREPEDWYVIYLDVDPFEGPILSDKFDIGYTEEEAKRLAQSTNADNGDTRWVAIHVPK